MKCAFRRFIWYKYIFGIWAFAYFRQLV